MAVKYSFERVAQNGVPREVILNRSAKSNGAVVQVLCSRHFNLTIIGSSCLCSYFVSWTVGDTAQGSSREGDGFMYL